MGKSLLAALCAMLLSFFSAFRGDPPVPAGGTCRCLAVGMDLFVSEENTAPCSANNAEVMASLFTAYLPEKTRVSRSVNGRETLGNWSKESWMFSREHGRETRLSCT